MASISHTIKQHAATAILVLGVASTIGGSWVQIKAVLAQWLIQQSWQQAILSGTPHKPWPWADTAPIARLVADKQQIDVVVLDGVHGESLAFGPGMLSRDDGRSRIIAGHRDTHFNWLNQLQTGDEIRLQTAKDGWQHYQVQGSRIADSQKEYMPEGKDLLLTTCYPFNAVSAGGPLRYVVSLSRMPSI